MKKRKEGENKQKKRISLGIIPFLFLIFFLVFYVGYFLFTLLNIETTDPMQENVSSHKILSQLEDNLEKTVFILEREKGDKRRISDVYVFLSNKEKKISLLIYIPGSLYFNGLEENFGSAISISSLRYAGDFLQENRGVEYTLWQLSEILGLKVDNYIWITTEAYEIINEVYGDMNEVKEIDRAEYTTESDTALSEAFLKLHTISSRYSNLKTFFNIKEVSNLNKNIYSNLSFVNVLRRISTFKNSVKAGQTNSIDIGTVKYSIEKLSEQGGQIRNINVPEFDKVLREYMFKMTDRNLEEERVRIEVYNASEVTGRAGVYARKIQNNGCDVVRFGNAPGTIEKTQVYISNKDDFNDSLNVVSEVLLGKFEVITERPSFMTTGDIVILLGEDISQIEIF